MQTYNRTVWKDHIKDQYNNVIQQGTPVSAGNLNNIENQVVALSAKENVLAELVKETIPSGFTTLSDLDYSHMSTNPNTIKLSSDSVAYVNGYKVVIPAGTIITLDAPPTTGSRDDLVFLEVYKSADANGAEQLNWRLRVVDGVDFNKFSEGFAKNDGMYWDTALKSRGNRPDINPTYIIVESSQQGINDKGLYISGNGDNGSKTVLGTVDGYVYAIPMFKIHRRNSGGYSANNGNGALPYAYSKITTTMLPNWAVAGNTNVISVNVTLDFLNNIAVGEILLAGSYSSNGALIKVTAIDTSNLNFTTLTISTWGSGIQWTSIQKTTRKDLLFADTVDTRDIIDLRHKVSLTGFNYQQLLEENFDKLIRGELQTTAKTNMLKTYHGLPKTPIDANHVFYASFDGTTVAEVGGAISLGTGTFAPTPTGLGYKFNNTATTPLAISGIDSNNGTMDIMVNATDILKEPSDYRGIFFILDSSNNPVFCIQATVNGKYIYAQEGYNDGTNIGYIGYNITPQTGYIHVRLSWDSVSMYFRINGKLIGTLARKSNGLRRVPAKVSFEDINNSGKRLNYTTVSDVSVSNIDRGSTFATLPQDFIDGYARIAPAFNGQRQVFSDALTSQYTQELVKASGINNKQFTITQSVAGVWTTGDTIKVKGLGGEIISGVIDSDTALAKVVQDNGSGNNIFCLDDVSKISVGDILQSAPMGEFRYGSSAVTTLTVTAVDTVNKTITVTTPLGGIGLFTGTYLFESTTSSSSPVVKFNNAGTITTVEGTWSGLGTNEATFTITTTSGLNAQDIQVEYSLNQPAGAGGISEVLTATLAGEANGKKLAVNPSVHIRDDFAGKIQNSGTICPHSISRTQNGTLLPPSSFVAEVPQSFYGNIAGLDSSTDGMGTSTNGNISQILLQFNIIRAVEDKIGTIPALDKVTWLSTNLVSIQAYAYINGVCPSGNKAIMSKWWVSSSTWELFSKYTVTASNPTKVTQVFVNTEIQYAIDPNGMVNFLVYTDASDGVTPSQINLDYCYLDITLKTPTGYDVLAPENPRRDDGKSNILLVRKETKEIQVFVDASNTDGIVTYGDYVPSQGTTPYYTNVKNLTRLKGFFNTVGTGARSNYYSVGNGGGTDYHTAKLGMSNLSLYGLRGESLLPNYYTWNNARTYYLDNIELDSGYYADSRLGYWTKDKFIDAGATWAINQNGSIELYVSPIQKISDIDLTKGYLFGVYGLVLADNKLYLFVCSRVQATSVNLAFHSYLYELTNRPLIK